MSPRNAGKTGPKGITLADIAQAAEMPFTPQRIRDAARLVADGIAEVDGYGRREWRDIECPGLRIVVTRKGATYYFAGRVDGRTSRVKLGHTSAVELDEARAAASDLKHGSTLAAKLAPRKRETSRGATLKATWERYVAEAEAGTFTVKRRIRPNTLRSYRGVWSASLSGHGSKSLAWVAENVDRLILPLQAETPYAANRALALLSLLFRFAMKRRLWTGGNPVAESLKAGSITRHEEKPRQRFLSDAERQRFRQACLDAGEPWGSLFLFAHETGLRKRALLGLRWGHIHVQRKGGRFLPAGAALVVPADIMKAGRSDHGVDLRPEALVALERRWAARPADDDGEGHVFSWEDGSPLTSSPYERAFHDIATAAQVKGIRPHDLRRDLGARLVAAGTPLPIVAKILGHSPASIAMLARTYAPVSDNTAREWLLNTPSIPKVKRAAKRSKATA
jgi:integrase